MTKNELIDQYFDWMYQLVVDERYTKKSYRKLFLMLHDMDFLYTIPMDGNRAEDGIDLRYRFGREQYYSDVVIASLLDDRPCSILEMMEALAIRCEEHLMDNPDFGNRTGQWFWNMISSLGLDSMDDSHFNRRFTEKTINKFLNRDYKKNGEGSLFTVNNGRDMRTMEIWYQMNFYLLEIIKKGDM